LFTDELTQTQAPEASQN